MVPCFNIWGYPQIHIAMAMHSNQTKIFKLKSQKQEIKVFQVQFGLCYYLIGVWSVHVICRFLLTRLSQHFPTCKKNSCSWTKNQSSFFFILMDKKSKFLSRRTIPCFTILLLEKLSNCIMTEYFLFLFFNILSII